MWKVTKIALSLFFLVSAAFAETPEGLVGRIRELIREKQNPPLPTYTVVKDPIFFVSPFSGNKADRKKFLALARLDFRQTLAVIRKDLPVYFIDTERGTANNRIAVDLNGKVDASILRILESYARLQGDELKQKIKGVEGIEAQYVDEGAAIVDEMGSLYDPPPFRLPVLWVDLSHFDLKDPGLVFLLQHEYLHYLFNRARPPHALSEIQLSKWGDQYSQAKATLHAILYARQPVGEPLKLDAIPPALLKDYWIALIGEEEIWARHAILRTSGEWDTIWVQWMTQTEMGYPEKLAAEDLNAFKLQIGVANEVLREGEANVDYATLLNHPLVLGLVGLKVLETQLQVARYLRHTTKIAELFFDQSVNQRR
jgi:hypothetical protein